MAAETIMDLLLIQAERRPCESSIDEPCFQAYA
jgi:hypothetical protein